MRTKAARSRLSSELVTTTISSLSHDGRGIAILDDGKTTFVSGALPGETVTFKLTKKHPRYNEGEVVSVLLPSPDRTTPGCAHFGVCGGCSMQHMNMAAQIQLKQNVLLEQLCHFGHVEPENVMPPISGGTWGYRRKARLGVRFVEKKGRLLIGFREKSSHYLADITACPVLHPSVGERLPQLAELIKSLAQYEHIPQIEIAVGDNVTALVIRHLKPLPDDDLNKLKAFAQMQQFHLYLQANPPELISKLWPQDDNHRLSYALSEYEIEMEFHPLDFTQVNSETNPMMIRQAVQLLEPQSSDTILDLFCGLGNFTLPIARSAKQVVGVEGSLEMVKRAQDNASKNAITNTEFFSENLADIPATHSAWMKRRYDKILLDPPRTGAKEIIAVFPNFKAERIVYVSCNPATLARDAGELVHNQGYKLKQVGVINMFPHTSHIEAITLFEK